MIFNIQFYKTSIATKPIADFILAHEPDVVCLQENFYFSDWHLMTLAPLNLDKEYFLANDCKAEHVTGNVHLSNTIYVRKKYFNFTQALSNVNLRITDETPRCSSIIQLFDTKIANVHLSGGRFDDKNFKKLQNHKYLQLKRLIDINDPDIILGDFNNENSEAAMMKQLNNYEFYQNLDTLSKDEFINYYYSGSRYLHDQTDYVPAYNETIIGSTSIFGGTPDWVYVRNQTRLTGRINNFNTIAMELSDHNAVIVEYLFPINPNV
ncbi:unnamed protein product [Rotaria sp. Silwood1]|nr:unnamed protein product [Rotaria sp. Silwood1]